MEDIVKENRAYWENRAAGYSEVNQEELEGVQRTTWSHLLEQELRGHFGEAFDKGLNIYDIGAGPGFLSIVLSELGHHVTAVDMSEQMKAQAEKNAEAVQVELQYVLGDAQSLSFADGSADVVISRNLTWNLPEPEKAYKEWLRILKPNGMLLVFDANWYRFLRDKAALQGYMADRENVADENYGDYNIGDDFDKMDAIADKLPMTDKLRPAWDESFFRQLKVKSVQTTEDIGSVLYSEKEKVNYRSTPLFMVKVIK